MPVAEPIQVNPEVLQWARVSSGLDIEEAAARAQVRPDILRAWESGQSLPSLTPLRKLATAYRRPLAGLLLATPPAAAEFPKDFRTVGGRPARMTRGVLQVLRRTRRIQRFVSEVTPEEPVGPLVGATTSDNPDTVGARERERLGITIASQLTWRSDNEAFNHWRGRVQRLGILTLSEPLPRSDCRGFALQGEALQPTIVVSSEDNDRAKSFTLVHEYGHLLLGTDAACLQEESASADGRVEWWCNRVAASILAPVEALERAAGMPKDEMARRIVDLALVTMLAAKLHVSRDVVAIRLEEAGVARRGFYSELRPQLERDFMKPRTEAAEVRIKGEQRWLHELGYAAVQRALQAWRSGNAGASEVAETLRVKADRLDSLARLADASANTYGS